MQNSPATPPVEDSLCASGPDQAAPDIAADPAERLDHLKAIAAALNLQAGQFDHIDWQGLAEQDPGRAEQLWSHRQDLLQALDEVAAEHAGLEQDVAHQAHRNHADRLQAGHAELARDLPGWSPQLAGQLAQFGQGELGFTPDELSAVHDPRLVKLLHRAFAAHQRDKADRIAQGQKTEPATSLRGSGGAFATAPDTGDFAAFEQLADSRLKGRR